jgi:manganese efflux pump family protein
LLTEREIRLPFFLVKVLYLFIFAIPIFFRMDYFSIVIIAIGLSMDSLAVSIANGLYEVRLSKIKAIKLALPLAIAQAIMPVIGWFIGLLVSDLIRDFDHWIAFILLTLIGLKMFWEGFQNDSENQKKDISFITVALQSVATSIDALAVGVTFALINVDVIFPSIIIGLVTFVFSLIGLYLGKNLGKKVGNSFTFIGGAVLILIGIKILLEHTVFQ